MPVLLFCCWYAVIDVIYDIPVVNCCYAVIDVINDIPVVNCCYAVIDVFNDIPVVNCCYAVIDVINDFDARVVVIDKLSLMLSTILMPMLLLLFLVFTFFPKFLTQRRRPFQNVFKRAFSRSVLLLIPRPTWLYLHIFLPQSIIDLCVKNLSREAAASAAAAAPIESFSMPNFALLRKEAKNLKLWQWLTLRSEKWSKKLRWWFFRWFQNRFWPLLFFCFSKCLSCFYDRGRNLTLEVLSLSPVQCDQMME